MKELIADAFIIAFFIVLAVNFSMLWLHNGVYFIYEHNKGILIFETVMTAGIGIIGIERLIDDLRKK
jgi:hypothetical protein